MKTFGGTLIESAEHGVSVGDGSVQVRGGTSMSESESDLTKPLHLKHTSSSLLESMSGGGPSG